jgi:uncharacterized protein
VILTDTGPLIALINRKDPNHGVCIAAVKGLTRGPLVTTWPCFTEAMYLLQRSGGFRAQSALWNMRGTGRLELHASGDAELDRMADLMATYHDLPMDLADASLIAAAESLGAARVFTLDRDFHVYRFADGTSVEVVP